MTECETTAVKNVLTLGCSRQLKAKDISIYIEDGQPYIHWVGEFSNGNDVYEVDIPKMDINIDAIVEDRPVEVDTLGHVSYPKVSFARYFYPCQVTRNLLELAAVASGSHETRLQLLSCLIYPD